MRDTVFLSHANPEDNEFTAWLAAKLDMHGYRVWSDITKLLGGEDFWENAEEVIRRVTAKFIYVLSAASNRKPGPRKELNLALNIARSEKIKDFVIPVRIDSSLSPGDFNIHIAPLNTIFFDERWGDGLETLAKKLQEDRVPREARGAGDVLAQWWTTRLSSGTTLLDSSEPYLSNWFPIRELPQAIYFNLVRDTGRPGGQPGKGFSYPAVPFKEYIVAFADHTGLRRPEDARSSVYRGYALATDAFVRGDFARRFANRVEARKLVSQLLRIAWQMTMQRRGLLTHEMSSGPLAFYFPKGLVERDRVSVSTDLSPGKARQVVGYRTIPAYEDRPSHRRFWHFGVTAHPVLFPRPTYAVNSHVVFSDDGRTAWDSPRRMHRARRSQCRHWWNDHWRDLLLGTMSWLSDGTSHVELEVAPDVSIDVDVEPLLFTSPVSYADPEGEPASLADDLDRDVPSPEGDEGEED